MSHSTSEYLQQLQTDKQTLVNNLVTKGVSATNDETFTSLVPKVLDIQSGSSLEINDCRYLFYQGVRNEQMNDILKICKNITMCDYMFYQNKMVTNVDLSFLNTENLTSMFGMFQDCKNLLEVNLSNFNTSKVKNMGQAFSGCILMEKIDISSFTSESLTSNNFMFSGCKTLVTVIINNPNLFKITNTYIFSNTPIANGTGYVYVPDNMVETYKSATNWSTYADQIKPISELPTEEV